MPMLFPKGTSCVSGTMSRLVAVEPATGSTAAAALPLYVVSTCSCRTSVPGRLKGNCNSVTFSTDVVLISFANVSFIDTLLISLGTISQWCNGHMHLVLLLV
jgi:hypothetical protein